MENTQQGDIAGLEVRLDAAGYGTLRKGHVTPQRTASEIERIALESAEDEVDSRVARELLLEIEEDPERVIRGEALAKRLEALS